MKNFLTILFILFLSIRSILLNGEIYTCEAESKPIIQSYEKYKEGTSENKEDIDLRDVSNIRYKILVITIRENLIKSYNKFDDMGLETDYLKSMESHVEND